MKQLVRLIGHHVDGPGIARRTLAWFKLYGIRYREVSLKTEGQVFTQVYELDGDAYAWVLDPFRLVGLAEATDGKWTAVCVPVSKQESISMPVRCRIVGESVTQDPMRCIVDSLADNNLSTCPSCGREEAEERVSTADGWVNVEKAQQDSKPVPDSGLTYRRCELVVEVRDQASVEALRRSLDRVRRDWGDEGSIDLTQLA